MRWPLAVALIASACTLPPLRTPTPSPSPTPTATPTPSPSPTPMPSPTPEPTPDPATAPTFVAGEIVRPAFDGLRVRRLPGLATQVVGGLLPASAELVVVMGPVLVDGFAWYLVRDHDPAEPSFDEAWIAAGFEPDPFLLSTGQSEPDSPLVASFAATGDAENGPVQIPDGDVHIRWLALDPERMRCTFAVSLAPAGGDEVAAIRATLGANPVPGTLQAQTFDLLGVRGAAFVRVVSDCAWTLVLARVPPAPSPEP